MARVTTSRVAIRAKSSSASQCGPKATERVVIRAN